LTNSASASTLYGIRRKARALSRREVDSSLQLGAFANSPPARHTSDLNTKSSHLRKPGLGFHDREPPPGWRHQHPGKPIFGGADTKIARQELLLWSYVVRIEQAEISERHSHVSNIFRTYAEEEGVPIWLG
jgi:hypothetical protein